MPHTVYINRDFDKHLVKEVKKALRELPPKEKEIAFRINSTGGSINAMNLVCAFIHIMRKYHKCKIIGQAFHAESAALLLFLRCDVRQVVRQSIGATYLSQLTSQSALPQMTSIEEDSKLLTS